MNIRIGVLGGTFNPIHFGHLVAAEEARSAFRLEKVLFMPSGDPPHKRRGNLLPAEERYLLALLAVADHPYFVVSRLEMDRKGLTYTTDTLRELRRLYWKTDFFFIAGLDAILELNTWKTGKALLRQAHFIAVSRPGYSFADLAAEFTPAERRRILTLEIPGIGISSTGLRARLKAGRSIRYLTPEPVADYLLRSRAFRAGAAS